MKSIKVPSPHLYNVFQKKQKILTDLDVINNLIYSTNEFNKMNKKINNKIIQNINNCNFDLDLHRVGFRFSIYNTFIRDINLYKKINSDLQENNVLSYVNSNCVINELLLKDWCVYYENINITHYLHLTANKNIDWAKYKLDYKSDGIIPYDGYSIYKLIDDSNNVKTKLELIDFEINKITNN
jgi:hypothetical protein